MHPSANPMLAAALLLVGSGLLAHGAANDPANLPFTKVGEVTGAAEDWPLKRAFPTPDGKWLITQRGDRELQIWDTTTFKPVTPPFFQDGLLDCYRISADRKTLFTSGDKEVRFWDVTTAKLRYAKQLAKDTSIVNSDGSPDGSRFVATFLNQVDTLVGWETVGADAKIVYRRRFPGPIVSVEYDPTGRWIAIRRGWGPFEVLDARTGKDTCAPIEADRDYNPDSTARYQAQFDPSGKPRLLIPKNTGYDIVDPSNGKRLATAQWRAPAADMMRFNATGSLVVVTTWKWRAGPGVHDLALMVDCKTGRVVGRFGSNVGNCQISADGKWALVDVDQLPPRSELWNLTTGVKVQEFPRAADDESLYAAMSPTGSTIAAESEKGITTIWQLRPPSAAAH